MNNETMALTLPGLPLKRTVLFPGIMMPLTVGRERSIAAVEAAMKTEDKTILVVAQRDPSMEEPGLEELYTIGTKAVIKQVGRADDGTLDALVQGLKESPCLRSKRPHRFFWSRPDDSIPQPTKAPKSDAPPSDQELVTELPRLIQAPGMQEATTALSNEDDPVALAYRLASLVNLSVAEEQKLLESTATLDLLRALYVALSKRFRSYSSATRSPAMRRRRSARASANTCCASN